MAEESASQVLPAGKLPAALLERLLQELPTQDERLLLGPGLGEDAAVIDFCSHGPALLVAKSDPITFATDAIGHYAVHVCANDLAVTGARPLFYLPTLLLPTREATAELAREIAGQIGAVCRQLGITVVGGHTEITPAVGQPVIAGTLLGQVSREGLVRTGDCRPGEVVLMAGWAPVEGASIIAREKGDTLRAQGWDAGQLAEAAHYLYAPGISVMAPALYAAEAGLVGSMHDPTEGGIATGLWEMAQAGRVGIEVDLEQIPIPALARRLCDAFGLDPMGVIASGCLLATAAPDQAPELLQGWRELGWPGTVIGQIVDGRTRGEVWSRAGQKPFPTFAADEIARLWA